ncbi:hypothetical protein [Pseudanabaena sp. UWO310]|uniref:hypothetical protein n=1 Tax=Pseudanabaena sp. UWO310 TaxID=2480795 RepID=UPI00115A0835|nr:hypothetical protein [Pseudanabaena sp. UWO310]TYQ27126.1 hypothetical protein PseudUWO310_16295 [Pseudanabaena sp. UWO310]
MFAQFRSQYPQGRIQTEMLPKIDGLHAFRAIVSEGDAVMGTATAVDSDLEIAEDRAIKRALTIAGLAFDNGFDNNYGNYGSPMLTQVSREPATVNSLPSANFNALGSAGNLSERNANPQLSHTMQTIQAEPTLNYASSNYGTSEYIPEEHVYYAPSEPAPNAISSPHENPSETVTTSRSSHPTTNPTTIKSSSPQIAPEPIDLSDPISKIDVEMERLNWTKAQGRDYLVRTFDKKSRQQLSNDELLQFLSYLRSLPTPNRQLANDDFF